MRLRGVVSLASALITLAAVIAFAQQTPGMKMNDESNPADMKAGEMDAMSMETMHDMHMGNDMQMGNMALHMAYTDLRPANAADEERADKIVAELKQALAKYQNYHAAEAAGFKPFHPEFRAMKVVHFTRTWYGVKAAFVFNPDEPTSLLYERTSDGGYKLIGAMYTDRKNATPDQLDERVPLSVARWHRHINLCFPPTGAHPADVDWTKFGFNGSIATAGACEMLGGRFYPQVFGWMVHVYPWDPNPRNVWAR